MSDNDKSPEDLLAALPPRPPFQPDFRMITYMEESEKSRLHRLAKETRKRTRQDAKPRRSADR